MGGPWENYQQQAASGSASGDGPWVKYGQGQMQSPQGSQDSFLGDMLANAKQGIQGIKDIANGNFADFTHPLPVAQSPKSQALSDKLFPAGSNGTMADALKNIGNTSFGDWAGSLNEQLAGSLPGKALSAIGGLNPAFN